MVYSIERSFGLLNALLGCIYSTICGGVNGAICHARALVLFLCGIRRLTLSNLNRINWNPDILEDPWDGRPVDITAVST